MELASRMERKAMQEARVGICRFMARKERHAAALVA